MGARTLGALLAVLLVPAAVAAQVIRGVVLEGNGTDPVVGATIQLLHPDSTLHSAVTTDRRGWFQLEPKQAGSYLLQPWHLSFTPMGTDSVSVGRHEIVTVVLRMGRVAIPLERLVVTARSRDRLAGFYTRSEGPGQGRFIHRPFIEARLAARPSQLLRMTPGVQLARSDDGLSSIITMRGRFGRCPAEVYLDGLPVPQSGMTIDEFTAADLLEGIEIYDAFTPPPAELPASTNECGIVAFWSRRDAYRRLSWKHLGYGALLGAILVLTTR